MNIWDLFPPSSNRGVPVTDSVLSPTPTETASYGKEVFNQVFITPSGKVLEVPFRRGVGDSAFIDTLTFSFHEASVFCDRPDIALSLERRYQNEPDRLNEAKLDAGIELVSAKLQEIFGFGIHRRAEGRGNRCYQRLYLCGDLDCLYASVHYGGQNNTVCVELKGKGCLAARDNWEGRLFDFLSSAVRPKITRVDVAKDFLNREYSPEKALEDWQNGLFDIRGKRLKAETMGSDWLCDTQNGKTFYVGGKESSKQCRIYDKAKQMGDKESDYIRFEIQFNGSYCLIPFEVLICPGEFFGGAFEASAQFCEMASFRSVGSVRLLDMCIERVEEIAKKQCGRAVNMLIRLGHSAEEIIEKLKAPNDLLPKRVRPEAFDCQDFNSPPIHEFNCV